MFNFDRINNEDLLEMIEEMDLDSEGIEEVKAEMELRIQVGNDTGIDVSGLEYTWLNNL